MFLQCAQSSGTNGVLGQDGGRATETVRPQERAVLITSGALINYFPKRGQIENPTVHLYRGLKAVKGQEGGIQKRATQQVETQGCHLDQRIRRVDHLIRSLSPDIVLSRRQFLDPVTQCQINRAQLEAPAPFLKESVMGKRRLWMEVSNLQRMSQSCPVS